MLTGTPLDLTPFGPLLSFLGLMYWLLALALAGVALWVPGRWWLKVPVAVGIIAAFVYPVVTHQQEVKQQVDVAKAELNAATEHFEMRCKSAGEKIVRAVDNVEGVVWMKWREKRDVKDDFDQHKLFDPSGQDCDAEECIAQLLRLGTAAGLFEREVGLRKGRFRYVESIDDADGKRCRYTGTMKLRPAWTQEVIEKYRRDRGADPPEDAHWFQLERHPIERYSARYGITWDDVSTNEDRDHWVAGGSLKVIDLQTNEVIAERWLHDGPRAREPCRVQCTVGYSARLGMSARSHDHRAGEPFAAAEAQSFSSAFLNQRRSSEHAHQCSLSLT
jgi:hypothetical protein